MGGDNFDAEYLEKRAEKNRRESSCVRFLLRVVKRRQGREPIWPSAFPFYSILIREKHMFLEPSSQSNIGRKILKFFCGLR